MTDPDDRSPGGWLIAVALTAAAVLALAAFAVGRYLLGVDLGLLPTVTTAIVVGVFLALIAIRPRRPETEFKVRAKRRP